MQPVQSKNKNSSLSSLLTENTTRVNFLVRNISKGFENWEPCCSVSE